MIHGVGRDAARIVRTIAKRQAERALEGAAPRVHMPMKSLT
jgi:hypothetical protein